MASRVTNFVLGFTFGFSLTMTAHNKIIEKMLSLIGRSMEVNNDYLSFKDLNLGLQEKRDLFKEVLLEKGPSTRLLSMISDANLKTYKDNMYSDRHELNILEETFRSYYPELFDDKPGYDFIHSLNLKTKCNDNNIPKIIKIRK
jgi:hypothetical protein